MLQTKKTDFKCLLKSFKAGLPFSMWKAKRGGEGEVSLYSRSKKQHLAILTEQQLVSEMLTVLPAEAQFLTSKLLCNISQTEK